MAWKFNVVPQVMSLINTHTHIHQHSQSATVPSNILNISLNPSTTIPNPKKIIRPSHHELFTKNKSSISISDNGRCKVVIRNNPRDIIVNLGLNFFKEFTFSLVFHCKNALDTYRIGNPWCALTAVKFGYYGTQW